MSNFTLSLIDGNFENNDAFELLSALVDAKIRFHEKKISASHNEEDVKMRERRIQKLQLDLMNIQESLKGKNNLNVSAVVTVE